MKKLQKGSFKTHSQQTVITVQGHQVSFLKYLHENKAIFPGFYLLGVDVDDRFIIRYCIEKEFDVVELLLTMRAI